MVTQSAVIVYLFSGSRTCSYHFPANYYEEKGVILFLAPQLPKDILALTESSRRVAAEMRASDLYIYCSI